MAATPATTISDIANMDTFAITRAVGARALDIDVRTITRGIEDGSIPAVKVGRRVLIPRLPFLALFGASD
ncbi:helix-turn-helix domain-containing protein [Rhodococcus qingshengii]|uniref:helix-turn-helix domain-containing protein n=1 Tax=Rhodococcus qingshengii TaxID=334542 RepID=UPI001FD80399|nr:helix-turn-helix domain-containing protein [Rhodococcus qingshengii]